MAKKKSRASKVSMGGRQKAHVAQETKRQAKFAAKRESGNAYEYKANPYKKGTRDWHIEAAARAEKAQSSRLPLARLTSIFAKLDNQLAKEAMVNKDKKDKREKAKA